MRPGERCRILLGSVLLAGLAGGPLHADEATATTPAEKPPATMREPGPDLGGDFPNGVGVVPVGRLYLETGIGFLTTSGPRVNDYSAGVLIRAGITPRMELRFSGVAIDIIEKPGDDTMGAGPVALGLKYSMANATVGSNRPAVGFEFQAELPIASAGLDGGVILPSFALNVDHTLPAGYSIHWNLDLTSNTDAQGDLFAQVDFQWSMGKDLGENFNLYATGYVIQPATKPEGGTNSVAGPGFLWFPNDRTAIQLTVAWGLTDASPDWLAQATLSFAF